MAQLPSTLTIAVNPMYLDNWKIWNIDDSSFDKTIHVLKEIVNERHSHYQL